LYRFLPIMNFFAVYGGFLIGLSRSQAASTCSQPERKLVYIQWFYMVTIKIL